MHILPNTGFITLRLLGFGVTVNGVYYRDNLLAQKLPDMSRLSQDEIFVFQQYGAPAHRARDTVAFREREARETRRRLRACGTRGTFRARILTILSRSVMTTLLNKPYFSLLCANSVVR